MGENREELQTEIFGKKKEENLVPPGGLGSGVEAHMEQISMDLNFSWILYLQIYLLSKMYLKSQISQKYCEYAQYFCRLCRHTP